MTVPYFCRDVSEMCAFGKEHLSANFFKRAAIAVGLIHELHVFSEILSTNPKLTKTLPAVILTQNGEGVTR